MAECHNYGEYPCSRVAISDRQNRHFRIGVGKFSDRPEFSRQSRQFLSAKSAKIGEIGESAEFFCRIGSRSAKPKFFAKIATLPCSKNDCKFVAYAKVCLRKHETQFHGTGRRRRLTHEEFACQLCEFTTIRRLLLDVHMRIHQNRQIKCEFCSYTAVTMKQIHDHILYHFRIKNFFCPICPASFHINGILTQHLRMHSKDYACTHCLKVFSTKNQFDRHVRECDVRLSKFT